MKCPKCGSENTEYVSLHHSGSMGSFGDACCGMMLLGPIGILCGMCGASPDYTEEYWVCHSCGEKFKTWESKLADWEQKRKSQKQEDKIQEEINAKARRKALLESADPEILQNIEHEITTSESHYNDLKLQMKEGKRKFLECNPECKTQNTIRMIGRGIFSVLIYCIAFFLLDQDFACTVFASIIPIGIIWMMPPYYIELSPELTELTEAIENAEKHTKYLKKLKEAYDEEKSV